MGQALMEAQRYPNDFDGIIAGAPAADWFGLILGFIWNQQAMYPDPQQESRPALPNSKLGLIDQAVNDACDAADGVQDGLISNPLACDFQPIDDLPICPDIDPRLCRREFLPYEVDALEQIFSGPSNSDGSLAPGFPVGGEFTRGDWASWMTFDSTFPRGTPNAQYFFAEEFGRYFVFDDPNWDLQSFDFDRDVAKVADAANALTATDSDLSEFADAGGKLLIHHGWADPAISALSSIGYHEQVVESLGGRAEVNDFMRLFLLPGVTHDTDGKGPNSVDWLAAIEAWVEDQTPPEMVLATSGNTSRSRPLCVYPRLATWDGVGDPNDASSFSCQTPSQRVTGDVDGDGRANFADFLILADQFGSSVVSWHDGDLDGDATVAFADFLILSGTFEPTSD